MLNLDRSGTAPFLSSLDAAKCQSAIDTLLSGSGEGSDFTGWLDLPVNYDKDEFSRIQAAAKKIQTGSQALVVIGIGGSYLGARAVIELLKSPNYNALRKDTPDVYFMGNGLSADAIAETISLIGDRDFSINVISSPEPPQNLPLPSASSKSYWSGSTEKTVPERVFTPPPTRPAAH